MKIDFWIYIMKDKLLIYNFGSIYFDSFKKSIQFVRLVMKSGERRKLVDSFKKLTVKEIEKRLEAMSLQERENYLSDLLNDPRKSVRAIGTQIKKKQEQFLEEKKRIDQLCYYENIFRGKGYEWIAGIDEAGRGPLAGPVVAAAVIFPHPIWIEGIDDSKKLTPKKRESLFEIIQEKAISVGIGISDHTLIDRTNILFATKMAMLEAIEKLSPKPECLLIDAVTLPDIPMEQMSLIKGESKSISIAAASIVAKVTRDRIMDRYHEIYPEYGFNQHKGYPTKQHYLNIERYGVTEIHRKTFLKNFR